MLYFVNTKTCIKESIHSFINNFSQKLTLYHVSSSAQNWLRNTGVDYHATAAFMQCVWNCNEPNSFPESHEKFDDFPDKIWLKSSTKITKQLTGKLDVNTRLSFI